jgi:hypothetical protein
MKQYSDLQEKRKKREELLSKDEQDTISRYYKWLLKTHFALTVNFESSGSEFWDFSEGFSLSYEVAEIARTFEITPTAFYRICAVFALWHDSTNQLNAGSIDQDDFLERAERYQAGKERFLRADACRAILDALAALYELNEAIGAPLLVPIGSYTNWLRVPSEHLRCTRQTWNNWTKSKAAVFRKTETDGIFSIRKDAVFEFIKEKWLSHYHSVIQTP